MHLLQVVSLLKDDSTFIQELFARFRSPSTSMESKKNLVFPDFKRHLLFSFMPQYITVKKYCFSVELVGLICLILFKIGIFLARIL